MSQLTTIVSHEYKMDIKAKSFWISTFLIPILIIAFGVFISFMSSESDVLNDFSKSTSPDTPDDLTGLQAIALLCGTFLTLFVIMFGAQIFNKVKTEKCNRIVEIIVSCAPGRSMMFAKVISVGLIGLTQLAIWTFLFAGIFLTLYIIAPISIDFSLLFSTQTLGVFSLFIIFFTGGYVFYGSLFAIAGALTDRNNENQGYLSVIMILLMSSFYIGIYAVDNMHTPLANVCFYLPFTSSTVGVVGAITGDATIWETLCSIIILFSSAAFSLIIAGKIYTVSLLLKGKKFSPKDIVVFLKAK